MNKTKFIISVISLFILFFIFDYIWHDKILYTSYLATSFLWRDNSQSVILFPTLVASYLITSILMVTLYKIYVIPKNKDLLNHSLKAGILLGSLLGTLEFSFYVYMPIPFTLAFAWFIGKLIPTILASFTLYFINKKSSSKQKIIQTRKS